MTIPPPQRQPDGWDDPQVSWLSDAVPGYDPAYLGPAAPGGHVPHGAPVPPTPGPAGAFVPHGAGAPYGTPPPAGPGPAPTWGPGYGWQDAPPTPPPARKTGVVVGVVAAAVVFVVAVVCVVVLVVNNGGTTAATTPPQTPPTTPSPTPTPTDDPEPTDTPTFRDWEATGDVHLADKLFPYEGGKYWSCTYSRTPLFTNARSEVFCSGTSQAGGPAYFIIGWDDPQTAITAVSAMYPAATHTTWAHGRQLETPNGDNFVAVRCYSDLPFCIIATGKTEDHVKTNLGRITVLDASAVQELKDSLNR